VNYAEERLSNYNVETLQRTVQLIFTRDYTTKGSVSVCYTKAKYANCISDYLIGSCIIIANSVRIIVDLVVLLWIYHIFVAFIVLFIICCAHFIFFCISN